MKKIASFSPNLLKTFYTLLTVNKLERSPTNIRIMANAWEKGVSVAVAMSDWVQGGFVDERTPIKVLNWGTGTFNSYGDAPYEYPRRVLLQENLDLDIRVFRKAVNIVIRSKFGGVDPSLPFGSDMNERVLLLAFRELVEAELIRVLPNHFAALSDTLAPSIEPLVDLPSAQNVETTVEVMDAVPQVLMGKQVFPVIRFPVRLALTLNVSVTGELEPEEDPWSRYGTTRVKALHVASLLPKGSAKRRAILKLLK